MTDKFLALIPARYASTRFPGKPLAEIHGKPMIQHVYERALSVFNHAFVATDDVRIEKAVKAFGGNVVMTSEKHKSGTDRCLEALDKVEKQLKETFDVVINIQGDEPFIEASQLELISSCFEDKSTEIATLVKKIEQQTDLFDINKPKVVLTADQKAIYFSRQAIPYYRGLEESKWLRQHTYYKHIGLYAYRSQTLRNITKLPQSELELAESLEQLRWIENGYKITVRETHVENMAVDTPADLQRILRG
ncbi:MAG: 3-deoxy-manno-octulosonate cytidylyltransferase [Salinivirgaceae bacterium]|nr:MAG: 3-deoxy-manno-octulosonate cytidylyltransferase [Salinivirgaceae bacterium]